MTIAGALWTVASLCNSARSPPSTRALHPRTLVMRIGMTLAPEPSNPMIDKQLLTTLNLAATWERTKSSTSKRATAPGPTQRDTATAPQK